jgi:MFS transporter, YNFM family, putative membrane transport protein
VAHTSPSFRSQSTNDRHLIWALSVASVIVYINLYLMQGMLPSIAEQFAVSAPRATLILSATSFSLAFSLLFYALLSDRLGRRSPIVLSLWLLALSNVGLLLVTDFAMLFCLRLLQGILLAAVPAIAMAYFREQLAPQFMLRAAAFYIAANSIGGIAGRLLGGLMSQLLDWQGAMLLLILLTVLGVGVVTYLLPPAPNGRIVAFQDRPHHSWTRFRSGLGDDLHGFAGHLQDKSLRLVYLIGGLAFMVMVNQFSFIQLHLMAEPFHWSRFEATLIFLSYLGGTFASYKTARWVGKWGALPLYRFAALSMMLGTLLTLVDTQLFICLGFLLTASGFFSIHSCCNAQVAIRAQNHRAKATALYLCSYYLGASLGGPYLMLFWQQGLWLAVVIGSLIILSVMALLVWYLGSSALESRVLEPQPQRPGPQSGLPKTEN